ncbi:unnamed protein product [Cyclocybe aegerita]|uniref:Uncharacterized protein n=1 Tax=Cyclocybe aegerita TaxID=1973307 RepID=A0A8S0VXQ5_CYCAE|nr:unnamed protein product [Cyclocybe aegerita]
MHIFRSIKLGTNDEAPTGRKLRAQRIKGLKKLLKRNPTLASYIVRLEIVIPPDNEWLGKDSTFLCVMKKISNSQHPLQTLSLRGFYHHLVNPSSVWTNFMKPFILPFITSLELRVISKFPLSILCSCPQLRKVILWASTLSVSASSLPHPNSRPQLQSLEFGSSNEAITSMLQMNKLYSTIYMDLSTLQTLKAHVRRAEDLTSVQQLINKSEGSLLDVSLVMDNRPCKSTSQVLREITSADFNEAYLPLTQRVDLHTMHTLQRLEVEIFATSEDPLAGIISVLQTVPTLLYLELMIYGRWSNGHGPENLVSADWKGLNAQLERISEVSKSLRAQIGIAYEVPRGYPTQPFQNVLGSICTTLLSQSRSIPHLTLNAIYGVDYPRLN